MPRSTKQEEKKNICIGITCVCECSTLYFRNLVFLFWLCSLGYSVLYRSALVNTERIIQCLLCPFYHWKACGRQPHFQKGILERNLSLRQPGLRTCYNKLEWCSFVRHLYSWGHCVVILGCFSICGQITPPTWYCTRESLPLVHLWPHVLMHVWCHPSENLLPNMK